MCLLARGVTQQDEQDEQDEQAVCADLGRGALAALHSRLGATTYLAQARKVVSLPRTCSYAIIEAWHNYSTAQTNETCGATLLNAIILMRWGLIRRLRPNDDVGIESRDVMGHLFLALIPLGM
jgi:hypothetical protein